MPVANAVSAARIAGRGAAHAAHGQAEEDRRAGDRAEKQGLRRAHVRVTLHTDL